MFYRNRFFIATAALALVSLAGCPPAPRYTLSVQVVGGGAVSVSPSGGTYDAGTSVSLAPVPAANWHFDHWEGALTGNANPAQVVMDADTSVTAVFVLNQYALTIQVTGQGTVTADPAVSPYDAGTTVALTPVPAAGWHFDHWEGALTGNANPEHLVMDTDISVTAVFVLNQYALTIQFTGQGTVTADPAGSPYDAGTTVSLTPVPAAGWHFDHWEGALIGNANPAQVVMDTDTSVTAVFVLNQLALTVQVSGGGAVALSPPGGLYDVGTTVILSATPNAGWHFDHWEGDVSGGATVVELMMDADRSVTAIFEREQYTLTVSPEGGGTVLLDPPGGTYPSETVVTLTPNPNPDSRFEIWGGDLLGTKTPATIAMNENKYVRALFMPKLVTNLEPSNLCAVGSTLYFAGNGIYSGRELWKSDGTFEGTMLVKDIAPLQGSSEPHFLVNLNGTLYFFDAWYVYGLWKSDGTEDGTVMVADLGSSFPALPPVKVGARIYWSAISFAGGELWSSDGTTEGTGIVKSFGQSTGANPNQLTNVDGVLYFNNSIEADTFTLWKSDGTEAGTVPLYSTRMINGIAAFNGDVYFSAGVNEYSLFTSDGTEAGTRVMRDFYFGPGDYTVSGGLLYFTAETLELYNTRVWATNGTDVYLVEDDAYRPWDLIDLDGTLIFEALYDVEGVLHCGLFASTGTGAYLLRDVNPNLFYGVESYHVVVGDTLYFAAENSVGGLGLWKTNGTGPGTVLVSEINPTGLGPYYLTDVNGTLFFAGQDDAHGYQLWKSNGTLAGTLPISCPTP